MKSTKLAALIASYFSLGVGIPAPALAPAMVINGALLDPGSLISTLSQLTAANLGADSANFLTSAAATITITGLQNLTQRLTNGGAVTVTLDSAYNIINLINNPFVGQTFPFTIITNAATTVAAPTLTGTSVTLSGTTTVLAAAARWYQGQITQVVTTTGSAVTAGTTFTSLTQVGTTNRYTVALATNTISPTVGNAIFINVSAGTLPSGWYPIDQVTSATSFVISTPATGTAWTATAATIPGTVVIPASQFTPSSSSGGATLAGIYSPLLTLTGMMATVTGTMSV